MELALNMMVSLSSFLVKHLYRWILPSLTTLIVILFASRDRGFLILFALWFLLCVSYLSIPLNFLNPKKENFGFLFRNSAVIIFWIIAQVAFLSFFVFSITLILIVWYLPSISRVSVVIGALNGFCYFITITLEYSLIIKKNKMEV